METIKVGLLGLGTVGTGVARIIKENQEDLFKKTGYHIEIKKVLVKNLNKKRNIELSEDIFTDNPLDVIMDKDIQVLIEVMGGIEETKKHIIDAINQGKHIVTANKDLIAISGQELFELADQKKCDLMYEAAVAGAIPIVRALKESLAADDIVEVMGILNGTTNYILSKMTQEGADFADVLKEAQELGYAEADPTSDVEGYDAARKTAILASIAFSSRVTFDDVNVEGITKISARDIAYAKDLGYVIKLLGVAKRENGQIEVRVNPTFIPNNHPLAAVNGVYNAVFVKGKALGDAMFYGRGAGELPTASAVMGDVVEVLRNIRSNSNGRIGCTCYHDKNIKDINDIVSKSYIRLLAKDEPGVLAGVTRILGENNVSVESIIQRGGRSAGCEDCATGEAEVVLVTHTVRHEQLQKATKEIGKLAQVARVYNIVRVEEGGK
ncbi:homoserine dehydrogenase [Desulfuribacillus stibiiarsenatis]|uniref:Homoserine dehydrogenase n=1 Tax=Desulfuribacillus stibiiarsenatis TaxID=1390249 RepID=A0A1E5L3A8_9FIRM|nr:homoserine dehydrogenase [Desulfuribacillus stibiiarsenatis]OEH84419.1 homoserine dehydrogenase [Desulfuribacillus stibiiarsenatis]